MQRARWFLGQGPMGRRNAVGANNEGKLFRWIVDRRREQVVHAFGDLTAFDPTNTGPGGGSVNASSGNNEVWRGIFAADTPTWTKLQTQFGPASTGVVPSMPINAAFSSDPFQDDYIVMPGFFRMPGGAPQLALPISPGDGPGALITLTNVPGFASVDGQQWPVAGNLFVFIRPTSVGGEQEIIQYTNKIVNPDGTSGTVQIVQRRVLGSTGGIAGWPAGSIVFQLGQSFYNDSLNPLGPIGDYDAYVMDPTIQATGYAHWHHAAFAQPPSGYGGDSQSTYATMDWHPSGTKSTYRFFRSGGSGFLVQKLNRTTLPGTWSEIVQGSGVAFLNETMTASTPAAITLSPPATDPVLYPPTGGLLLLGSGGNAALVEAIRYSSQVGGVLTISQRGASMLFQNGPGVTIPGSIRQNTTAQAHTGGGNITKAIAPNTALNGFNCEAAQTAIDVYGRGIYAVAFKGGIEGMAFGPSATSWGGGPGPYQPFLMRFDIATSRSQCISPLPDSFDFGIGQQVPFETGQGRSDLVFDPLNRVFILPNQRAQHNGPTDGWYLYHVDAPTRVFNIAASPGWELESGPYPSQGNQLIWDDFRNCGLWMGSSSGDSGVDTYYRYAGGPTIATAPTLSLGSLSPSTGLTGTACTLTGTLFGASQGTSVVHFGTGTATAITWSATTIGITIPSLPVGTYNISVTVGSSTSNTLPFTIVTNAPTITSVSPPSGPVLSTVTITGTNFGLNQLVSTLTIGGAFATVLSWGDTQVLATVPASLGIGVQAVVLTTVNGSASSSFTVTPPAPTADLVFDGLLRDRVGPGNTSLAPDGALDGTFTVTGHRAGGMTVTGLQLAMLNSVGTSIGVWDTLSSSVFWVLGAALSLDDTFLNNPVSMGVSFTINDGDSFKIFASDLAGTEFLNGNVATLTVTYSDSSTSTTTITLGAPPPPPPPPPSGTVSITLLPYGLGNF